jgi:ribose transport system substrate-binding protein/inositol transport system substrate-binding protein
MLLTACSSGGDSPSGGAQDGASAEASMARATERLDEASQPVTYSGPEEPLDRAAVEGENVCIIAVDTGNQFVADISDHAADAFEQMGIEAQILNGRNDPNQYTAYIRQCIQQGVAGIMLQNIGSLQTPEGTRAAAEAGIPIITSGQIAATSEPEENVDSFVAVDTRLIGELQSDLAYRESDGDVHAVGFGLPTLVQDNEQLAGQKEELERLCPDTCSYEAQHIELGTFQTELPNMTRSSIIGKPDLTWLFPAWDILATYVIAGVKQAQVPEPPKISSYNGIESARQAVLAGDMVATFGLPLKVWGYAAADTLARLIAGQEAEPVTLPFRMLTKETLEPLGADASEEEVYGSDETLTQYRELWGS